MNTADAEMNNNNEVEVCNDGKKAPIVAAVSTSSSVSSISTSARSSNSPPSEITGLLMNDVFGPNSNSSVEAKKSADLKGEHFINMSEDNIKQKSLDESIMTSNDDAVKS